MVPNLKSRKDLYHDLDYSWSFGSCCYFVIVSYNGLVKNRMQTKEAWSQIDVQLKRRNDLLPNLIETVKGYAKYEGSTLEKVAELRNQVAATTSPAEAMKASDALTRQVSGILQLQKAIQI